MLFSSFPSLPPMTASERGKYLNLSALSSSASHTAKGVFRAQTCPSSCPMSRQRPERLLAGGTACKLPESQLVSAEGSSFLPLHGLVSLGSHKSTGSALGLPAAHANKRDCHHMSIWLEGTSGSLYSNLLLRRGRLPVLNQVSCGFV